MVISDAEAGKVVTTPPIGEGCDGVAFDPATKRAFSSNGGDGTITVVQEENKDSFKVVETVADTKRRPHDYHRQNNPSFVFVNRRIWRSQSWRTSPANETRNVYGFGCGSDEIKASSKSPT